MAMPGVEVDLEEERRLRNARRGEETRPPDDTEGLCTSFELNEAGRLTARGKVALHQAIGVLLAQHPGIGPTEARQRLGHPLSPPGFHHHFKIVSDSPVRGDEAANAVAPLKEEEKRKVRVGAPRLPPAFPPRGDEHGAVDLSSDKGQFSAAIDEDGRWKLTFEIRGIDRNTAAYFTGQAFSLLNPHPDD